MPELNQLRFAIIGLGYVGLPLAIAHDQYRALGIEALRTLGIADAVIYDIKGLYSKDEVDGRL